MKKIYFNKKVKLFSWLDREIIVNENKNLTEFEVSKKAFEFRRINKHFHSMSFETIVGSGNNAAIVHYKPDSESSNIIERNKILLIDSGAHYLYSNYVF